MVTDNDCLTPLGLILSSAGHADYWRCHSYLSVAPQATPWSLGYLWIFTLTNLLEFPIYFAFLGGLRKYDWLAAKTTLTTCLALNLATHPLIFFVFPALFLATTYRNYLIAAEIFAPAVEAMLLAAFFKQHWALALAAAVGANLFSWWLGVYLS